MPMSAELVFLAIQAGVRLYAGLRTAYVASVREATLALPLPRTPGLQVPAIVDWFSRAEPRHRPLPESALARTLDKARRDADSLAPDERSALENAYNVCYTEANPPRVTIDGTEVAQPALPITSADYLVLTEVRQWADGAGAPPTGFQRVAGTLVDVAVFWFANRPGAISDRHPMGRALLAFLKGVEHVGFAETAPPEILDQVLVGVLETVAAEPRLVAGGRREEALVTSVASAVSGAIDARFKTKRTNQEESDAASWAQLVARTMLKAGAETVLADPKLFLGVDSGDQSAVIRDVGTAFVDLVVPDDPDAPDQIALKTLVSGAGLETLVRATLKTIGEHPGVLGLEQDRRGITTLLGALASAFAGADVPSTAAAAFPEIAQTILALTARHLDEVWGGDRNDVERNLLVLATRRALETLAQVAGGRGDPLFAKEQMIELFDAVLAEVAQNPRWVVTSVGGVEESKVLTAALEAAMSALRGQQLATLSGAARVGILKAALKAGGLELALMRKIPPGGRDAGRIALEAVIDATFGALATGDADARWRVARSSALVALFEVALERLVSVPGGDARMQARVDVLRAAVAKYAQGRMPLAQFADLLTAQLEAVA